MKRVAVTGIGLVTPLGDTVGEVFAAAHAGRSAVRPLRQSFAGRELHFLAASASFAGAAHFDPAKLRMLDRVSQLGVVAARRALADAALDLACLDRRRVGVFVGTGMGASHTSDQGYEILYGAKSDRIAPMTVIMGMHNSIAAWIGIEMQIEGPNLTYSTACSSSAVAIGEAWLRLQRDELEIAFAGGAEAPLSLGSLVAWDAMRTLARIDPQDPATSCKPFAKDRSGMVLADGAVVVVLEEWQRAVARGASIYGEVLGYGLVTDYAHIARPSVAGQAAAMRAALHSAQLDAHDIGAINAHGTGTPANDAVETAAIRLVFGSRAAHVPISATKAIHGHLLGAAGAMEMVLSILAMRNQVVLPTMHLRQHDPECDLDYVPNQARTGVPVHTMLSNSFAFGGTNAVLALRAA